MKLLMLRTHCSPASKAKKTQTLTQTTGKKNSGNAFKLIVYSQEYLSFAKARTGALFLKTPN